MLRPRWKKVLRDLWLSKTRTFLVVLSIAVGVFAFGTIAAARDNILRGLHDSYLAVNPVSATLTTDHRFDDDLVDTIRRMPGVEAAEGRRRVAARVLIGPNEWYDLDLFVLPDDGKMTVNIVRPVQGAWPPPAKAVLIERSSLGKTHAEVGEFIEIELAGEDKRTMRIAGLAHDLSLPPAPIAGKAFGYINFDTLEWLGSTRDYDQLQFVVAERPLDEDHIWEVAARVADKIEQSGREVTVTDVPTPQQHPAEIIIPTILVILTGLGIMALVLAMFLIVNTIEAILAQQVRQIGILKAIGAQDGQIMLLYFGMVLGFGVLALLLAIPLGTLGAYGFTRFMAGQLNFDVVDFKLPVQVLTLKVLAALLLPIIAAVPAIRSSVRVTVREALSNEVKTEKRAARTKNREPRTKNQESGSKNQEARTKNQFSILHSPFLVLGSWFLVLAAYRPLLLSLRNTFRRKGRLIRTLVVLTLGGAVFISVLTVRASLYRTLDATVATKHYDIELRLARPYRNSEVVPKVMQVPGVVTVEGWRTMKAYPIHADGSEGENIDLYALPAATPLLDLPINEGRWLLPTDQQSIVLSSNFLTKEPDTQVGDTLVLKIDGEEYTWQIVGISYEFTSPVNPALGYVNYPGFVQMVGGMGQVNTLQISTTQHDVAFQSQVSRELEAQTERDKLQVRLVRTMHEELAMYYERFNLLTAVLSMMATLIGIVGGLGLMGTMSINVIERTKEIGIMRAIGASDRILHQIVISEGVLIGLLAWLIGTVVSGPLSYAMSIQLGYRLLNQPLRYSYAFYAVVLWLVIVVVVAALASYVPARSASRVTVREVLAYE